MHLPQHLLLALIHRARAEVEDEVRLVELHLKINVQEVRIERKVQIRAKVRTKATNHPSGKARVLTNPRADKARNPESVARSAVLGGTLYSEGFTELNPAACGPIRTFTDSSLNNSTTTDGKSRMSTQPRVEKVSLRTPDPLLAVMMKKCHRLKMLPLLRKHAGNVEPRISQTSSDTRPGNDWVANQTQRAKLTSNGQQFSQPSLAIDDINRTWLDL